VGVSQYLLELLLLEVIEHLVHQIFIIKLDIMCVLKYTIIVVVGWSNDFINELGLNVA
jgi:hypothetical protein